MKLFSLQTTTEATTSTVPTPPPHHDEEEGGASFDDVRRIIQVKIGKNLTRLKVLSGKDRKRPNKA